ncbi:sensor histidine kinase [Parafrigoribacterium mesophilum]|uniref:sensor histidine kinase n=1 Tax=Parafrigoribacterium mesophilum TaxID=433646 RepID=UPI0031FE3590
MPYPGQRAEDGFRGPWEAGPPGWGPPRWARLWLPVIVSFLVQVPAVFWIWRRGPHGPRFPWHDVLPVNGAALALGLVIALIGPVALIAARRAPGPVVAIVTAAATADVLLSADQPGPPYIALAFAIVSAIVRGARIWAWLSVAAGWLVTIIGAIVLRLDVPPSSIAGTTLGILIVMGIGEGIRSRRERVLDYRSRLEQRKQSDVQAERMRIARELHDVLAHSLSQINVQAGVGLHLMDKQPQQAAAALASIKEVSKTALDEVRSVLGILRAEDGADPGAPLVPEPDLSRLPGLAASITAQGIVVQLHNSLTEQPPAAVQMAIYRIVQESLTNVVRHAQATTATVDLTAVDGAYRVHIADDGVGAGNRGFGRGLTGMRERAELLGGSLTTAPGPGGGFQVTATIPARENNP